MVEAGPAGGFGVKGGIGIEVTALKWNAQAFDELEGGAEIVLQFKSVIVIARDNARCGKDEPVRLSDGQDIGGLGFLAPLIGDRLTAFLGGSVAAVEVEVMRVDLVTDTQNAVLEHPLQAAIAAPLAIVMVDRVIADFFFFGSSGGVVDGQALPLTAGMQSIQDVVEHFVQWDAAFVTSLGNAQRWTDVLLELVLC